MWWQCWGRSTSSRQSWTDKRGGVDSDSKSSIFGIMKTTVDIPDAVLKEAMRHTKASTKREAIVKAMEEYNRRQRLARLAERLGASETFMSFEELMKLRD